jgi:hypothetical protein
MPWRMPRRARATQTQVEAEDAARRAHWANALAEGQERRVAEEYHSQRALQRAEAEMLELTMRERCCLANLRQRNFWAPPRSGGAGPSGVGPSSTGPSSAGGGAGTSSVQ